MKITLFALAALAAGAAAAPKECRQGGKKLPWKDADTARDCRAFGFNRDSCDTKAYCEAHDITLEFGELLYANRPTEFASCTKCIAAHEDEPDDARELRADYGDFTENCTPWNADGKDCYLPWIC